MDDELFLELINAGVSYQDDYKSDELSNYTEKFSNGKVNTVVIYLRYLFVI